MHNDLKAPHDYNVIFFSGLPGKSLFATSSPESFLTRSAAGFDNLASFSSTDCVSWAGRRPAALFFKPCAMPASTAPDEKCQNIQTLFKTWVWKI